MYIYKHFTKNLLAQKGIGNKTLNDLLLLAGNIKNLYEVNLPNEFKNKYGNLIEKSKNNITGDDNFVCIWEDNYPSLLKEIHNPPIILYYRGEYNSTLFNDPVSIVGTRSSSKLGENIADDIVKSMINLNRTVVSGLATGIDSIAHKSSIKYGLNTVAVLGTPIEDKYLRLKKDIARDIILKGGIILSEYEIGTNVNPGLFARRNRIIAGLSMDTFIVEAGLNSGALITAEHAFHENRNVYAIPWNINHVNGLGCNKLIKEQKATILYNIANNSDINLQVNKNIYKMSNEEQLIFDMIKREPTTIDSICGNLNMKFLHVTQIISMLEMNNLVLKDQFSGYYKVLK